MKTLAALLLAAVPSLALAQPLPPPPPPNSAELPPPPPPADPKKTNPPPPDLPVVEAQDVNKPAQQPEQPAPEQPKVIILQRPGAETPQPAAQEPTTNASAPEPAASPTPTPASTVAPATPAAAPQAAVVPAPPPPKKPTDDFVKGELSSVGSDRLTTKNNRIGVAGGYNRIGNVHYALVYPQVDLHFGKLKLGLGIPLNLEIFNANYPRNPASPAQNHIIGFDNAGHLRTEDWDELSEYARPLVYVTYGNKEDHLFVNVGQRYPASLGHGTVMRRYAPNLDVNVTRVSAEVDAYNDYLGMEAMTNDVFRWSIVGLIGFLKPLSILGDDSVFGKSVSLGATFVADREAPTSLQFQPEPDCRVGSCAKANVPLLDQRGQLVTNRGLASVFGVDLEAKVVKTDSVDIKPYLDYSMLLVSGGGGGFTGGILGRFNFGTTPVQAFRVRLEGRYLGAHYRASYFDTFYEVDKFLYMGTGGVKAPLAPGSGQVPATKLQATVGPEGPGARPGFYAEASYGIRDVVGLTLALEGEGGTDAKNFIAHLELPAFSFLQLFGSFYKRGFTDFGKLTALDESAVAFAGARLKLLPILFVNARAFKTFAFDGYPGPTGPIGTLQYTNAIGYAGDVELGYEF